MRALLWLALMLCVAAPALAIDPVIDAPAPIAPVPEKPKAASPKPTKTRSPRKPRPATRDDEEPATPTPSPAPAQRQKSLSWPTAYRQELGLSDATCLRMEERIQRTTKYLAECQARLDQNEAAAVAIMTRAGFDAKTPADRTEIDALYNQTWRSMLGLGGAATAAQLDACAQQYYQRILEAAEARCRRRFPTITPGSMSALRPIVSAIIRNRFAVFVASADCLNSLDSLMTPAQVEKWHSIEGSLKR